MRGTQNECCVSMLRKLGNICCGHEMFLNKIRNIFCVPDTKFVSATNVARTGKRGNICVGNNVSRLPRSYAAYGSLRPLPTSREHGMPQNSRTKIYFSNLHS